MKNISIKALVMSIVLIFTAISYSMQEKLKEAITFSRLNDLRLLIEQGAKVNEKDENEQTPLHYISKRLILNSDTLIILKVLLEAGARIDIKDKNQKTVIDLLKEDSINNSNSLHQQTSTILMIVALRYMHNKNNNYQPSHPSYIPIFQHPYVLLTK